MRGPKAAVGWWLGEWESGWMGVCNGWVNSSHMHVLDVLVVGVVKG